MSVFFLFWMIGNTFSRQHCFSHESCVRVFVQVCEWRMTHHPSWRELL